MIISFTFFPDLIHLAAYGKVYSIPEGEESSAVTPLNYLSEVLLDVLHLAEGLRIQKIHETKHLSYEFAGTFTMEQDILHKMHVTLSVDDENKVEFFEVTNPSGKKHLFSQFEDGMVVFSHPGKVLIIIREAICLSNSSEISGLCLVKMLLLFFSF